jgi:hypothetical protein
VQEVVKGASHPLGTRGMEERVVRRVFDDHECGSKEGKLSVVKIENVPKENRTLVIS